MSMVCKRFFCVCVRLSKDGILQKVNFSYYLWPRKKTVQLSNISNPPYFTISVVMVSHQSWRKFVIWACTNPLTALSVPELVISYSSLKPMQAETKSKKIGKIPTLNYIHKLWLFPTFGLSPSATSFVSSCYLSLVSCSMGLEKQTNHCKNK